MKTGFIYIWYDRKHKKYYIGSHLGTEDDGYICSSRWMRQSYKRRPQDFKRRILQRGIFRDKLKETEYEWLKLIKEEELGKRYYNLNNKKILKPGNWPEGNPRPEETRKKVSEGVKKAWEEGRLSKEICKRKPYTEDELKQISEKTKDQWRQGKANSSGCFKKGQTPWNKGNSDHITKAWANDPDRRKRQSERMKKLWKERKLNG